MNNEQLENYIKENKQEIIQAFTLIKNLGCPHEKYRDNSIDCFHCTDCWLKALAKMPD